MIYYAVFTLFFFFLLQNLFTIMKSYYIFAVEVYVNQNMTDL